MNKYFLTCYSALSTESFQSTNVEDVTCPLDQDLLDSLCPLNLMTGLREDPLVRVNDPNISDSERQSLLASLPKVSTPQSPDVDDSTKLQFVKLRSLQTPSELSAYSDFIKSCVDSQPAGDPAGDSAGDPAGDSAGDSAGDPAGDPAGE